MISIETILRLHELSITHYGGSTGIRDGGLMESAIARPFQTFG
jgi:death on curing protein